MYPEYTCPYTAHKKMCSFVRAKCPKWIHFIGRDPNTGREVDSFDCADRWLVRMQMEIAKEVRQGAAATESFRNMMFRLASGETPEQLVQYQTDKLLNGR